jgi:hypothetical protein
LCNKKHVDCDRAVAAISYDNGIQIELSQSIPACRPEFRDGECDTDKRLGITLVPAPRTVE